MGEEMRRVSMKELWKKGMSGNQRGAFIVFTALAIWFLMMFVAFAVDFGNYYQHRTRLQNAADAAALAGVAKYAESEPMTEKGMGRLVALPANITEGQDGQATTFSADSYTFTQIGGVPLEVQRQAESYVSNNYVPNDPDKMKMIDSMWNASQESTSTTSSQETWDGTTQTTTTTTPRQYCYRVDLEDKVPTFFARIFGLTELPISVSAMAMLDGKQITTLEEQFVSISEQISKVAANYIWETITRKVGKVIDSKTNDWEWTLANGDSSNKNVAPGKLGEGNVKYYVVTGGGNSSLSNVVTDPKIDDKTGKIIIGYKEPEESDNIGVCAEPILYEGDLADWDTFKNSVTTRIFTIDADWRGGDQKGIMYNDKMDKDIQVLFLNRDHIGQRKGPWEKFTEINIGRIVSCRGVVQSNPLYLRLESEPLCMNSGGSALMMVHGTTINVRLKEADVKNSRQVVFAYDGPDPQRKDNDAPWMAIREADIGGEHYKPGETFPGDRAKYEFIYKDPNEAADERHKNPKEPLLNWFNSHRQTFPKDDVVKTASKTSGPIDVYIDDGCVLYGAIFAPWSRVILHGSGKIQGFILAREIVRGKDCTGNYEMGEREVEMPVLIAERVGNDYQLFNYRREYIRAIYKIASSTNINKLNFSFMALQ